MEEHFIEDIARSIKEMKGKKWFPESLAWGGAKYIKSFKSANKTRTDNTKR